MPTVVVPYTELNLVVVRGLRLASAAPTVTVSDVSIVTPASAALTITGHAKDQQVELPIAGSLALSSSAPTAAISVNTSIVPPAGALSFASAEPTRSYGLLLAGYTPNVSLSTPSVAAATLALVGTTPTIVDTSPQPHDIPTFERDVTIESVNPALEMGSEAEESSLGLEGQAPVASVTSPLFSPGNEALGLTTYAPFDFDTITFQAGALAISTAAPTLGTGYVVTPSIAALGLVGYAPTVFADTRLAQPGSASLALATNLTYIGRSITPEAIARVLIGYVPTALIGINRVLQPTEATFTLAGYAPVAINLGYTTAPAAGSATFAGYAPTLGRTENLTLLPGAGAATLTGYSTQSIRIQKQVGSTPLTLTGHSVGIRTKRTRKETRRLIRLTTTRHTRLLYS